MGWEFTPYAIPYIIPPAIATLLFFITLKNRDEPGVIYFLILLLGIVFWSGGVGLEIVSTDPQDKFFWYNWRLLGVGFVTASWVLFTLEYTGRERWIRPGIIALLFSETVLTQIFAWTNASHELVYSTTDFEMDSLGSVQVIDLSFGIWFWVHAVIGYLFIFIGAYLIVREYLSSRSVYKGQTRNLVIGAFAPWIANAVYLSGVVPVDTTPFGWIVACIAIGISFFRYQLLDVVPVARDKVIENMRDAVIVVDNENRIVDTNPAAREIFVEGNSNPEYDENGDVDLTDNGSNEQGSDLIGDDLDSVLDPEIVEKYSDVDEAQEEIDLIVDEKKYYFDLRISPVYDDRGRRTGRLVVLRDITPVKKREQELEILNRIVRHDIRNDMNVILGRSRLLQRDVKPEGEENLDLIIKNSEHVIELTETVRELMESITEDEELELQVIDLGETIEEELEKARTSHSEAVFSMNGEIPYGTEVKANEMLSSVFTNLFNNAVQHNDKEVAQIEVGVEDRDETVLVKVMDNGPGIPEDQRDEIFGRGEKGLESEGTGVGLYLVDTLTDQYGGSVEITDNEPEGTVFNIELQKA